MNPTDGEIRAELDRRLELIRLARGWSNFVRLVERIRRKDAGEPVVRIHDEGRAA